MKSYRHVRRVGKAFTETAFAGLNGEAIKLIDGIKRSLEYSEQQMALAAERAAERQPAPAARGQDRGGR